MEKFPFNLISRKVVRLQLRQAFERGLQMEITYKDFVCDDTMDVQSQTVNILRFQNVPHTSYHRSVHLPSSTSVSTLNEAHRAS